MPIVDIGKNDNDSVTVSADWNDTNPHRIIVNGSRRHEHFIQQFCYSVLAFVRTLSDSSLSDLEQDTQNLATTELAARKLFLVGKSFDLKCFFLHAQFLSRNRLFSFVSGL
jgi:hypothetical protein